MATSVHDQIQAELAKKKDADDKIKNLKAKEATRLGRVADKVGLYEVAVSDDDLVAGLEHAIKLAKQRLTNSGQTTAGHASA